MMKRTRCAQQPPSAVNSIASFSRAIRAYNIQKSSLLSFAILASMQGVHEFLSEPSYLSKLVSHHAHTLAIHPQSQVPNQSGRRIFNLTHLLSHIDWTASTALHAIGRLHGR